MIQFGAAGRKFTFLGVCIVSVAGGYHIHQREYIKDLLKEWGLQEAKGSENLKEESAQYVPKEAAAEDFWAPHGEVEEEIEKADEDIKKAQAIAGALNWLCTRTRPDLSFAVSRISSMATLAPLGAAALAKKVLMYLIATGDLGINYFGGKAEDEKKLA